MPGRFFSSIPVTQVFRQYTENKKRWKYPLLFVQFAGTAFLVGMTCVVFSQYHYTMSKDLGYNMERLASVYDSYEHVDNRNCSGSYLNGPESVLYSIKISFLYRIVLFNLLGIIPSLYHENLISNIQRWNSWNDIMDNLLYRLQK